MYVEGVLATPGVNRKTADCLRLANVLLPSGRLRECSLGHIALDTAVTNDRAPRC
jgi:hypothetical protein